MNSPTFVGYNNYYAPAIPVEPSLQIGDYFYLHEQQNQMILPPPKKIIAKLVKKTLPEDRLFYDLRGKAIQPQINCYYPPIDDTVYDKKGNAYIATRPTGKEQSGVEQYISEICENEYVKTGLSVFNEILDGIQRDFNVLIHRN